jgi:hypothetical protein
VRRRHLRSPLVARRAARSLCAPLALLLLALLLLAACSGGSSGQTTGGVGSLGSGAPAGTATSAGSPAATDTPVELTTPGAPVGFAGLCAQKPSVSAQLPAAVPAYPGAQIHLGQSANGSGLFGFCTNDGVAAVDSYYAAQLPAAGWQHVSNSTIDATQQLMADKGNAHVIVTILPDSQVSGATDLIITTSGL